MSQIISFEDYTPSARFDAIPWSEVRIDESDTDTLSDETVWTQIDVVALSPLDGDPTSPATRNFTTDQASDAADLWYRVTFADANGNTSLTSAPVQNLEFPVVAYATVETLAAQLKVNAETRRVDLQRVLDAAAREINTEIGYNLDTTADEKDLALVATVNLSRAADLWVIEGLPVGVIGLGGETPFLTPRNSWERHANTLAPLKQSWGLW